jgi:hypothetical protein
MRGRVGERAAARSDGAHPRSAAVMRRAVVGWVLVPVLALLSLTAWALSSPAGSSPDDDFHLASIWCAAGERSDLCEPAPDASDRRVARDLIRDSVCFAYDAEKSAGCQGADFGGDPDDTVIADHGNFDGLYPPVYYALMNPFATPDIATSVLLIRMANSLLAVALVSVLYALLPARRRTTLVWALVVTAVPLGMFLIPSTNPSGWAVLSAGTLWLALLGYFESTGRRRLGLGAVAVVATVIGAGARADSAVYCGIAVVVVAVLVVRRDRSLLLPALLPVGLLAIAVALFLSSQQSLAASTGLSQETSGGGSVGLLGMNLLNVPELWAGAFGKWGLGWLDTALPAVVWVCGTVVFGGVVLRGFGGSDRRRMVALSGVMLALLVIPAVVLTRSQAVVGAYVQPRYILPLIVLVAGVALLTSGAAKAAGTATQRGVVVGLLSVTNAVALHANIRRYVTGVDVGGLNLDSAIEWWWSTPASPMTVWVVGSLAFAAALVPLVRGTPVESDPGMSSEGSLAPAAVRD